jgi:endogenous inhibitor of DNA gyrase (YacG/DUF329 family)
MNYEQRVRILERQLAPPPCPECQGKPHRVVTIDPNGEERDATMPATGCPLCGAPVFREYRLEEDVSPWPDR